MLAGYMEDENFFEYVQILDPSLLRGRLCPLKREGSKK